MIQSTCCGESDPGSSEGTQRFLRGGGRLYPWTGALKNTGKAKPIIVKTMRNPPSQPLTTAMLIVSTQIFTDNQKKTSPKEFEATMVLLPRNIYTQKYGIINIMPADLSFWTTPSQFVCDTWRPSWTRVREVYPRHVFFSPY